MLACPAAFAEAPELRVRDVIPPGFESLAGPRTVYVDVYFADRRALTTAITTDGETLRFEQPSVVAAALGELEDADTVATLLANDLPTNVAKVCRARADPPGCGQVEAAPIAVLFDEAGLRLDLFLDPTLQVVRALELDRHLPAPPARGSMVMSLSAAGQAQEDRPSSIDVIGSATASIGATYLHTRFDYETSGHSRRVTAARLTHHRRDLEWAAGTVDGTLGAALPSIDLIGLSLGHSTRTRLDLDAAFGSPLVVYLPRRSTVQLLVDDRVRSVQRYAAGNQTLDTRALPSGTYEVEIRIDDPVTGQRVERELYTRSARMPPHGERPLALSVGALIETSDEATLPSASGQGFAALSGSTRLGRQSSITLGAAHVGSLDLGHVDYLRFGKHATLQASLAAGTANTISGFLRASTSLRRLTLAVDARSFRSSIDRHEDAALARLITADRDQISASATVQAGHHSFGARASLQRDADDTGVWRQRERLTLDWRWPFVSTAVWRGYLQGDLSLDEEQLSGGLRLRLGARPRSGTDLSLSAQLRQSGSGTIDETIDVGATRTFDDLGGWNSRWTSRLALDAERTTVDTDLDLESDHVGAALSAEWSPDSEHGPGSSVVGSLRAGIGVDTEGWATSGAPRVNAGVLLSTVGTPETGELDVLVNGARVATVAVGDATLIGLSPYRAYRIDVLPRSLLVVEGEGLGETFTLLPGNVHRIAPEIYREALLVGVLTDDTDAILGDVSIERGELRYPVDAAGVFQVPARPGETLTVLRGDRPHCRLQVPEALGSDYVYAPAEAFVCR